MDTELESLDKNMNVEVDGVIENGKQFDVEINVPRDNRNVIFGILKDEYGDPIEDAVVKLIEVEKMMGKEERKPVSHAFTDEDGEFVFGPLCPNRSYDLQIWVNKVKHVKICKACKPKKQNCLKGVKIDCKNSKPEKPKDEEYCPLFEN